MRFIWSLRPSALCALLLAATPIHGQDGGPTPWEIEDVRRGLSEVGTAFEITRNCPVAEANEIKGLMTLLGLNQRARKEGFTDAQIDAFLKDDDYKQKLEEIVWRRLVRHGATKGDASSVCLAAAREIEMNTLASTLFTLRAPN